MNTKTDTFITLTEHAKKRALRRFWINEDRLREMAQQAVMVGYSIADAPNKKIARYLRRKAQKGNKVYVWDGYIFILSDKMVLVTTFRMPKHLLLSLERESTYVGNDHG